MKPLRVLIGIHQHHGHVCLFQIAIKLLGIGTYDDHAVEASLLREFEEALVRIRAGDDHMIAFLTAFVFDAAKELAIKRVVEHQLAAGLCLRAANPDQAGLMACQSSRGIVRHVAQAFHRAEHQLARFRADALLVVEHIRDRRDGQPGVLRNIFDRDSLTQVKFLSRAPRGVIYDCVFSYNIMNLIP